MHLNGILMVFLLQFMITDKIYSSPLHIRSKGIFINDMIRYSEAAMYKPEEVQYFHNRWKRSVGGVAFNKPLRISFYAHNRPFNLVLRTDDRIFSDDVVFDSTSRSLVFDTRRVYAGVLEDEENSWVQGIVTKDGLFDGTIFSKNEMYYVEPIERYIPSKRKYQNSSLVPHNIHTIIYKTSDVQVPPSFRNHPCASHSLHLSRKNEGAGVNRAKRSTTSGGGKKLAPNTERKRDSDVGRGEVHTGREKTFISSLPSINSHEDIIESNILKTYINVPDINRTRKKVNVTNLFKFPKFSNEVFPQNNVINRPKIIVFKNVTQKMGEVNAEELLPNGTLKHVNKRATVDPKKTTCMLYLQADHLFYQKYGTEEACIDVMTRHVQRVNAIYKSTDFNQDGKSDNISFMIKRIKVHTSESSKDPGYRFPGNYGVEKFLELFSEEDYDAFCLAYMFTYRDFEMGTLGLAWTGDLKNAGGVCEKNGESKLQNPCNKLGAGLGEACANAQMTQLDSSVFHYRGSLKSLNTGIVTLLNYGKHVPPAVSHVTLAHEIGHNFGSPHDPESCTPGGEEGNYIMFARATSGDKKNNNKFSPCSLSSINPVLNSKARSQMGCFTEPQTAICGNGVVEVGEDCDCGWEEDCRDSCCFPQRRYPPAGEVPCKLTPSSICSPSQGPCCTSECQLKFGDKCREDNGCRDSSYCDGRSPSCPPSINKPNKTICNDEFVCFMGECTGSICLAYGLESCQCIPGPNDALTKACELCCKKPGDDQPCISSFEWNEGPYDVPDMFSKPGTPCNNYNGYCDVFQKCREVDPSGPLATLRKLLLSEESLASVRKWVSDYWYAVALIIAFVFLLLYLSATLLGKHSDVKLKPITIIHSPTTETVRLPPEGDPGLMVHPPAVRAKLPLHRKVREKKLHTKVVNKRKKKDSKESNKKKENQDLLKSRKYGRDVHEVPKDTSKSREYRKQVSEESRKSQKTGEARPKSSEKVTKKEKSDKVPPQNDSSALIQNLVSKDATCLEEEKAVASDNSSNMEGPIYENIQTNPKQEESSRSKIISGRLKRSNRVSAEITTETAKKMKEDFCERRESKSPAKIVSRKNVRRKMSPTKKKKNKKKKEVIEYENNENESITKKSNAPPSEDPLGKVQNWLMHSISVGKPSENFGIMTLTLPKSKSSPVGLSASPKQEEIPIKQIGPPKIVHKNDRIIQIPKLSQKRSRSAGNLRKSDNKRDEKVKVQVVYKPPFRFSVKLRNNRVLNAVTTKFVDERNYGGHLARKGHGDGNEKKQRTALLVRTGSKRKSEEDSSASPHVLKSVPPKENETDNPFKFPCGVTPASSTLPQLPIYLTDQGEIDSNVHTVPSDLDVLLSESEFLFSD